MAKYALAATQRIHSALELLLCMLKFILFPWEQAHSLGKTFFSLLSKAPGLWLANTPTGDGSHEILLKYTPSHRYQ